MKTFFSKPYRWGILFSLLLLASTTFVLLKAFVLPEVQTAVVVTESSETTQTITDERSATENSDTTTTTTTSSSEPVITDTSYVSAALTITITEKRLDDTTIYIADVQTDDASHLKTALAQNSYGRNIKELTSEMAESHDAILAINGDYYGFRSSGYVVRNGTLYRDTPNGETDALMISKEGDFSIINEADVAIEDVLDVAQQVLSFGPVLVEDGEVTVDPTTEVSQSKSSNPRTAIGQIAANHYVIIVSDGRTDESEGLSLYELAQEFKELGAATAYNLDGGGSSTLYFNGKVVNQTVGGRSNNEERSVSDIVYFN